MTTIHEEALKRGVHSDCWSGGPIVACETCRRIILGIFGERYDDVPPDRVRTIIETDRIAGRS